MLTRFLLLFIALGCGVDRSPVFTTGSGAIGGSGGISGGGGIGGGAGTGGVSGISGNGGVGGTGSVCPTNCDDGIYCNGVETCGPTGCIAGNAPCTTACDEATRTCNAPCIRGFESCNGIDDDCNGMIDDGFGAICLLPNVSFALCSAATCVVASCSAGFLNCDGNASNGCETFSDPTPNDCKANVCGGGVTAQPNDTPIDDGNDCTIERCNGSTPETVNVDDGESCTNGNGTCMAGNCVY